MWHLYNLIAPVSFKNTLHVQEPELFHRVTGSAPLPSVACRTSPRQGQQSPTASA